MIDSAPTRFDTKQRFFRNSFFNTISWTTNIAVNLIIIPVMVRHLGVEGYGIYALLTSLFGYFSLLDLGLGQGVVKYVSHYIGLANIDGVHQSINATLITQIVIGGIGVAFLCVFNNDIIRIFNISSSFLKAASISLYISSISFFLTMVLGTYTYALQGLQRFDILGSINMIFSIGMALTLIIFVSTGTGLLGVIIISALFSVVNCLVCLFFILKYIPSYRPSLSVQWITIKQLFNFSGYVFLSRLAATLNTFFVRFIVGIMLGPVAVTLYVVPMKLISGIQGGLGSLINALFPMVSTLSAQGMNDYLKNIYYKTSKFIIGISIPVYLFIIIFSRPILTTWMGLDFASRCWPVLTIAGLAYLLSSWTIVPTNIAFGLGHSRSVGLYSGVVAILYIIFIPFLTHYYNIIGTAWAILITQVAALPFLWFVTKKIMQLHWFRFFKEMFGYHTLPIICFISVGTAAIYFRFLSSSKHEQIILLSIGCVLMMLYFITMFILRSFSFDDFRMKKPKNKGL